MHKKLFLILALSIILFTSSIGVSKVQKVRAGGTIYIRADGSVDPPTAPIQRDGDIYSFTNNISAWISVERSRIIIDGKGYAIQKWGFRLYGVSGITIQNVNLDASEIYGESVAHITISGNNITNTGEWAIYVQDSSGITISENIMIGEYPTVTTGSYEGIFLAASSFCTISNNRIMNFGSGIDAWWGCSNINIYKNLVRDNVYGIRGIKDFHNSKIFENNIIDNKNGLQLSGQNNEVFHNNFINNTDTNVIILDSEDYYVWDNGYPSGGNYWDSHSVLDLYNGPYQNETGRDGIGDTPYIIDANNSDNNPLMGMFSSFNTSLDKFVNVVSNSTIEDFEYFESNSTIKMHVSNITGNQTHGFVRISIPYTLMSEPYNVTIEGANPTYWNYTLYDNGTHRWIYFAYEHSTLEIIIIPEFQSLIILPLFMLATLLVAIVYRRKRLKSTSSGYTWYNP